MNETPGGERETSRMGDPKMERDLDSTQRRFSRGANDLVISLSTRGRSIRLFTAEGDIPSVHGGARELDLGLGENVTDL